MLLRFQTFKAPRQWLFSDPDTRRLHRANDKASLVEAITSYRRQNNLAPIENLDLVLENYLCSRPENRPNCTENTLQRGIISTLKGGVALFENLFFGEKRMASQDTADRRSEICARCPYNIFPDKKGFIKWSDEIAEHSTGGKRSSQHDRLGNCGVCSCPLRAKVFFKGPFELTPTELNQMQEVGCWQPEDFTLKSKE